MTDLTVPLEYTAAGGVVTRQNHTEVLLLIRPARDEVRLPKGHVDAGETPEQAALREIAEESGYDDLELCASLGTQLVSFLANNRIVRRTEYYYLLSARSMHQCERLPEDVGQFFTVWVSWDEAQAELTFEAEQEWLRRARQIAMNNA